MEENNKKLRNILKGLPKVKAKDDFNANLFKRIRETESERLSPSLKKLNKKGFSLSLLLRPSLVPAIGLAIILLVFLAYYFNILILKKTSETTQKTENIIQNGEKKSDSLITMNEKLEQSIEKKSPTGVLRETAPKEVENKESNRQVIKEEKSEHQLLKDEGIKTDGIIYEEKIPEKKESVRSKEKGNGSYGDSIRQIEDMDKNEMNSSPVEDQMKSINVPDTTKDNKISNPTKADKKYKDTVRTKVDSLQQKSDTTKKK